MIRVIIVEKVISLAGTIGEGKPIFFSSGCESAGGFNANIMEL